MTDREHSAPGDHGSLAAVLLVLVIAGALLAGLALSHQQPGRAVIEIDKATLESDLSHSPRFTQLQDRRIVDHVEAHRDQITVVTGSGFDRMDFEDQATAIALVSAIAGPSRGGSEFDIYSIATRERIGTWSANKGLEIKQH